jgi:hypothetical protein
VSVLELDEIAVVQAAHELGHIGNGATTVDLEFFGEIDSQRVDGLRDREAVPEPTSGPVHPDVRVRIQVDGDRLLEQALGDDLLSTDYAGIHNEFGLRHGRVI